MTADPLASATVHPPGDPRRAARTSHTASPPERALSRPALPWRLFAGLPLAGGFIYFLVGDAWPIETAVVLGLLAARVDGTERGVGA